MSAIDDVNPIAEVLSKIMTTDGIEARSDIISRAMTLVRGLGVRASKAEARVAELEDVEKERDELKKVLKRRSAKLGESTKPRPMSGAPRDRDIYLVHRHTQNTEYHARGEFATTLGRWGALDGWWYGQGGYDLRPVGWYPVPHATDAQALDMKGDGKDGD